jgi:pimeloyl-ACP methyl ester carboxylesterase
VLIGHSQGGLYIQQFTRLYPDLVEGLILIDPLSANDNLFRKLLSPEDYRNSGVDKLPNFKNAHTITSFGLGFLLKPLLKKAPPFYYTGDFSKATEKYILSALSRPRQYRTAIA